MAKISLQNLVDDSQIAANTANQWSDLITYTIKEGAFGFWDPDVMQLIRLGTSQTFSNQSLAGATLQLSLTAGLAKPHDNYIPSWPDNDGYTFKIYVDENDDGVYETRASITAVNWTAGTVTIDTSSMSGTHGVRVSHLIADGDLRFRQEKPDNKDVEGARTYYQNNAYTLNSQDHLKENPLTWENAVLLPEFYRFILKINSAAVIDIDTDKSVTTIALRMNIISMEEAQAMVARKYQGQGFEDWPDIDSLANQQISGDAALQHIKF